MVVAFNALIFLVQVLYEFRVVKKLRLALQHIKYLIDGLHRKLLFVHQVRHVIRMAIMKRRNEEFELVAPGSHLIKIHNRRVNRLEQLRDIV